MKIRSILRKIALVISLVTLITSTCGTTYGYIVVKTDSIVNIFVPSEEKVNGLVLKKVVEHPFGEDYKIPDNITFGFRVELGAYYANATLETSRGDMTADQNGTLVLSMKPGVPVGIEGLVEGTQVTVTELNIDRKGFDRVGPASQTVTIGAEGKAKVTFVNTYTPEAVTGEELLLTGIKLLENRDWKAGDTFTYQLEQQVDNGLVRALVWQELDRATITYAAGTEDFNAFDFNDAVQDLTFDKVGTYVFRVTEMPGDGPESDYDKTLNHFTVKVTDTDMDGELEINSVAGTENVTVNKTNAGHHVHVVFTDSYVPPVLPDPDDITLTLPVLKTVQNTGNVSTGPDGFEFVLTDTISHETWAALSDDDGQAAFTLTYTKADIGKTYTYTIHETDNETNGMTYDDTVYTVTVTVTRSEENTLVATVSVTQEIEDGVFTFENVYYEYVEPTPPTGDRRFTFWLTMMLVSGTAFVLLLISERKARYHHA